MALGIHTIVDRNEVASSNAAYALRLRLAVYEKNSVRLPNTVKHKKEW